MFTHCMPIYVALSFHWKQNKWELLYICVPNFCDPFKNYKPKLWKIIREFYLVLNKFPNIKIN